MRIVVLGLIAAALFGLLAYPLVTNQVPFQSDLGRYHLPVRDFYQKCLHNSDDPHWCPQLFCGFDLHGEGQGGFEHPWHRLLYTFLPLVPAFNIEVFINYPLLCWGMYLFLRRHQLTRESSLVGALWFTFSGFTIPHYSHTNAIAIIAHIPWLLCAADIQFTTSCPRRRAAATAFIAGLTGSQILLGYPQYVLFSGIAESLYVFLLMFKHRVWRPVIWWFVAKLVGVAIGGAQLLPTYQALQLSPRMGYDKHFRGTGSLPPRMFLQLVAPTMFNEFMQMNEYTVYAGMLATFAVLWLFASSRWRSGNVLDQFAIAAAGLSLLLAVGKHSPLYSVYLKMPVLGLFRFPCRYLVLFHCAIAVAVARFVERLQKLPNQPWADRSIAFGLLVPSAAFVLAINEREFATLTAAGRDYWSFHTSGAIMFVGFYIALLVWLLLLFLNNGLYLALALIFVVGFADLGYYNLRTLDLPPLHRLGVPVTNTYQFVDMATYQGRETKPPDASPERVDVPDANGNGLMVLSKRLSRGYVGLSPPKTLDNQPIFQRLSGTTWQFDGFQWNAINGLPLVRFVTQSQVTTDPKKDIETIDIAKSALVEQSLDLEPGEPGTATIIKQHPGRWSISTNAPTKQLLVIAQSFHPNWLATIDGQPSSIHRVNGDFQGVVIPTGQHEVRLVFDPRYRRVGRWLSWTGFGLVIAIVLLGEMTNGRGRLKS